MTRFEDPNNPINRAAAMAGGYKILAKQLRLSVYRLNQARRTGFVSADRAEKIEKLYGIPKDEMIDHRGERVKAARLRDGKEIYERIELELAWLKRWPAPVYPCAIALNEYQRRNGGRTEVHGLPIIDVPVGWKGPLVLLAWKH